MRNSLKFQSWASVREKHCFFFYQENITDHIYLVGVIYSSDI